MPSRCRRGALTIALPLVLGLPTFAARAEDTVKPPAVVVNGDAVVQAAPDRAFVTVAVESRDKNPTEAQGKTATAMAAVRKKLTSTGITDEQIRTVDYQLQLEFDYDKGHQTPRDYLSRDAIEVRLDDVTKVGPLIDAAVAAGATAIGSVRFDLKERDSLERLALTRAVADARARADAAAAGAGTTVTAVLRVEEQRYFAPPQPIPMLMKTAAAEAAPPTTINAGQIELRAQVTLTAAIK
jgi:uncharacterized protein YggE